jgi:hypothetical protein
VFQACQDRWNVWVINWIFDTDNALSTLSPQFHLWSWWTAQVTANYSGSVTYKWIGLSGGCLDNYDVITVDSPRGNSYSVDSLYGDSSPSLPPQKLMQVFISYFKQKCNMLANFNETTHIKFNTITSSCFRLVTCRLTYTGSNGEADMHTCKIVAKALKIFPCQEWNSGLASNIQSGLSSIINLYISSPHSFLPLKSEGSWVPDDRSSSHTVNG